MVATRPDWLLLFDVDGTLLRTNGAGRESTRRAMREVYGTEGRLETFHFGGRTDWQIVVELLDADDLAEDDIVARLPDYHAALTRHLTDVIRDYPVEACPMGVETVQGLLDRPEYALGLVTGNVGSTVPIKLQAAGYDPAWFPIGAYGHEAQARQALPPLAIERAEAHFETRFPPDRVIVIGDTPADVACARAAGAWAVLVNTGFESRETLVQAQADVLLDDLSAFMSVFPALSGAQG